MGALRVPNLGPAVLALPPAMDGLTEVETYAAVNDPVYVAGLEGVYLMLGGLEPSYAAPAARDGLVVELLTLTALTPGNRARLAAAVLRAWSHSYDRGPREHTPSVEYRLWAGQRVEVACA